MIRLNQIHTLLKSNVEALNEDQIITQVLAVTDPDFNSESLGWCSDSNAHLLPNLSAGNVIVSKVTFSTLKDQLKHLNCIPVDKPRSSFLTVLKEFFAEKTTYGFIAPSVSIDPSATFDPNMVYFAPNVVIEKNCIIGKQVSIGANTVIKSGTSIGDNCTIGCNNTIGGVGFGYEMNDEGEYELMPHIGHVAIKNNVEIGNNVCIDRAVLGVTLIEDNVKIDNLVHIAHGVQVGRNSLVIAHALVAGSVEIGENAWIGPSSAIRQKLKIGDNALVGLGSVVVKNVEANTVVAGNPAKLFDKK